MSPSGANERPRNIRCWGQILFKLSRVFDARHGFKISPILTTWGPTWRSTSVVDYLQLQSPDCRISEGLHGHRTLPTVATYQTTPERLAKLTSESTCQLFLHFLLWYHPYCFSGVSMERLYTFRWASRAHQACSVSSPRHGFT